MAKYTRKEFAALCHTTVLVVNTNKSRGNIIVGDDKKIDSENALNKAFFEKYQKKFNEDRKTINELKKNPEKLIEQPVKKTTSKKTSLKSATKKPTKQEQKTNELSQQIVDDAARKKKADADLQEYKAAHEKLKMDKLAGKLIPVDLVFQILNIHNKSIFSTFQSDAENLASVYCEILAEGDRRKLAELMTKISQIIDDNVNKSRDMAEIELENAIDEYSETLNRGQRK